MAIVVIIINNMIIFLHSLLQLLGQISASRLSKFEIQFFLKRFPSKPEKRINVW